MLVISAFWSLTLLLNGCDSGPIGNKSISDNGNSRQVSEKIVGGQRVPVTNVPYQEYLGGCRSLYFGFTHPLLRGGRRDIQAYHFFPGGSEYSNVNSCYNRRINVWNFVQNPPEQYYKTDGIAWSHLLINDDLNFTKSASLRNSAGLHFCGGTILNNNHVLTAAHCVYGARKRLYVVVGVSQVNGGELIPVIETIIHKMYDNQTLENDIAVLKVQWNLNLDNFTKRKLALANSVPEDGTLCTISGWGSTTYDPDHAKASPQLLKTEIPIYNWELCGSGLAYEEEFLLPGQICAGFEEGGHDSCQGDSGGPLQCNNQLIGIVSWGMGCGDPYQPGVYTSVPYFRDWILHQISSSGYMVANVVTICIIVTLHFIWYV